MAEASEVLLLFEVLLLDLSAFDGLSMGGGDGTGLDVGKFSVYFELLLLLLDLLSLELLLLFLLPLLLLLLLFFADLLKVGS